MNFCFCSFESFKVIHCSVIKVRFFVVFFATACLFYHISFALSTTFLFYFSMFFQHHLLFFSNSFILSQVFLFVNNFFTFIFRCFLTPFVVFSATRLYYHKFFYLSTTFLFLFFNFLSDAIIQYALSDFLC